MRYLRKIEVTHFPKIQETGEDALQFRLIKNKIAAVRG